MSSNTQDVVDEVISGITQISEGKIPDLIQTHNCAPNNSELANVFNQFVISLSEIMQFLVPLSNGTVDIDPPKSKNVLVAPIKEIHSQLMNLAWQAQQVANGDYTQRVDFLGEFSNAFNSMVSELGKKVEREKMAALGNMVAGVAHEINTPIGISITASSYLELKNQEITDLLQQGKMKKSDLDKYLETSNEVLSTIMANLNRASELICSFKQVAADETSEVKREFDVGDYMEAVVTSLRPYIRKTSHTVTINCKKGLVVNSYPGALAQIITNLIENSIVHAYDQGVAGNIRIDVDETNENIVITYSDDGKGMDRSVVKKIYEPFFTTNRGGGGTGLGMNIVYNIVTQTFAGTIGCKSKVGGGTVFVITIPTHKEG